MLSPRWRKVLRDTSLHKARTLLVVLALATALTAAGALLNTWALLQRTTAETYSASLPVSATLLMDHLDSAVLAEVRALPSIAAAHRRRTVHAVTDSDAGELPVLLFAPDDFLARDMAVVQSSSGTWPPRDGEIVIEKSSLEFSRATVGESVRVRVAGREETALEVSGVARDVSLAPGWMDHVVYGFVTPATLERLGDSSGPDELRLRVRDTAASRDAVRAVALEARLIAERHGARVLAVDVPVPGQHVHAAQMDSMMFTQGAFAMLALVACALLVVNLVTAMLAGHAREIGVMKALGASARQLAAMYLVFSLAAGAAASAIAIPLAVAIARPYVALKAELLNFPVGDFSIPWWSFALQLAAGALLPVVACLSGVVRACRVPVADALRATGVSTGEAEGFVTRRIRIPGLGRPLTLAIGNAFRRRGRMVLTLGALASAGAVFVAAHNLRASVLDSVEVMFAAQRQDFALRMADAAPPDQLAAAVRAVDGVAKVEAWTGSRASVMGSLGTTFQIIGLPVPTTMAAPQVLSGRWLEARDTRALVVSRALAADDPLFAIGAELSVMVGTHPSQWKVVGIVDGVGQPVAYATRDALNAARGDPRASTVVVEATPAARARPLDVVARTRIALQAQGLRVASSSLASENRRAIEDHLLLVVDFLGAMAWIMLAVGAMGLASTMGLAVLERTREIGIMRAIGAPHTAIAAIFQTESLFIALIAWLIALVLSVPASVAMGLAFGAVMFPVPMRLLPDLTGSLVWLATATLISIAACAWPSLRAMRIPAATALSR